MRKIIPLFVFILMVFGCSNTKRIDDLENRVKRLETAVNPIIEAKEKQAQAKKELDQKFEERMTEQQKKYEEQMKAIKKQIAEKEAEEKKKKKK